MNFRRYIFKVQNKSLSGLFFFILMYTGSNVLSIAELLYYSHMKQAFRPIEDPNSKMSDIMRNSILGCLLPHAMVYFLENHGASQFATVFLGEYDTPEAIWSNEMRQHLILKVAQHIADFTPRSAISEVLFQKQECSICTKNPVNFQGFSSWLSLRIKSSVGDLDCVLTHKFITFSQKRQLSGIRWQYFFAWLGIKKIDRKGKNIRNFAITESKFVII